MGARDVGARGYRSRGAAIALRELQGDIGAAAHNGANAVIPTSDGNARVRRKVEERAVHSVRLSVQGHSSAHTGHCTVQSYTDMYR